MSKYLCLTGLIAFLCTGAFAQNGTPSSKATADINTVVWCTYDTSGSASDTGVPAVTSCTDLFTGAQASTTPDNFVEIMNATVKVSNSQSLFVTPSLVTGLYTNTAVKNHTSGGTGSTSEAVATGGVYLRAVLYDSAGDMIVAEPIKSCDSNVFGCVSVPGSNGGYGVILDQRVQTLSQTLSGCTVSTGGTCSFDLTTQLILQTASAHTFGFIFPNVGVGTYTVSIQAAVDSDATTSSSNGSSYAVGASAFGLGSVTVQTVRLVHDFSF